MRIYVGTSTTIWPDGSAFVRKPLGKYRGYSVVMREDGTTAAIRNDLIPARRLHDSPTLTLGYRYPTTR